MKKNLLFLKAAFVACTIILILTGSASAQIPILNYPMENPSGRTTPQLTPDFDINGTGSAVARTGNTTTISPGTGAGLQAGTSPSHNNTGATAGLAVTSANWATSTTDPKTAATDYFQFSTSTTGFTGLALQFDLKASNSNAPYLGILYNTGSGWVYVNSQPNSGFGAFSTSWQTINVPLPVAVNNVASVQFRIYGYFAGGAGASVSVDNLQLLANIDIGTNTLLDYAAIYTDMNSGSTGSVYIYPNFTVGNGTSAGIVTMGNSNIALSGAMLVSSGTFNFGTAAVPKYLLSTASTFTVSTGATLGITDVNGITTTATGASGNIQSTGTRTFAGSANYNYFSSSAQVTGNGLPAVLTGALTINNSAGLTLSQSTTNTSGTIALNSGKLNLSTFNLTSAANISGVSATQYIQTNSTGQLNINVGASPVFFPVGNSSYNPITLANSGTPDTYGINVVDGTFISPYDASRVLNRRWQVSKATTTAAGVISATAQFNSSDPAGSNFGTSSPGATYIGFYNSSAWTQNTASTATGTVTGSTTYAAGTFGLTNLSSGPEYFAVGKDYSFISPLPTLTTVPVTAIAATGAASGGTALNQGAAAVTAKGIVWNTTASPVLPGLGSTSDGTGTGAYASTLASLIPQTQYYVSAFATNSYGTGYGLPANFYTLSSPPATVASGISATASNGQVILNWTGASFPASNATKAGYLLVYLSGAISPSLVPSPNGLAPASAVSTGTVVTTTAATLPALPATTATVTGLGNGTVYQFLLVPYTWDGTHPSTYDYGIPSPLSLTVCATVPPSPPAGLSLGSPAGTSIPGTTTPVASGAVSGYTVFYSTTNTAPVPVKGNSYNLPGSPYIIGGVSYFAIDQAAAGSFTASGLTPNTPYYFFVYSYSATTCGSLTPVYSSTYVAGSASTTPTVFYSASSGNLNNVINWWSNPNGTTGLNPVNFTTAGITYNIINNNTTSFTIAAAGWLVQGAGTIVNVGDGSTNTPTLTIDAAKLLRVNSGAVINVLAGSTLVLSTTATIAGVNTGTLAPTSTVNFASSSAQTIPALNYGNLVSSGTGARTLISSGTIGIAGIFTPGSNSYTIAGSTVNFNGTGQTIPAFDYFNLSNINSITLAGSDTIRVGGNFTAAGTYKVTGSTVEFNGIAGGANQYVPLIASSDLGPGLTAGGYNNLVISASDSVFMPYTAGSSPTGNVINIYGTLTCSGAGAVTFNNAVAAGNVNSFYIGSFISTASAAYINLGSIAGAGTSNLYMYGNFQANGSTLITSGTGNNAIVNFNGTAASPQQFSCATARQVWFYINSGALVNMTGNVVIGSGVAAYPAYLTVFNGGTLNCGTYLVTSQDANRIKNAYFSLQSGGTLGIGSPYGITTSVSAGSVNAGNIQLLSDSTATLYRSFSSSANYVYNGTTSQVTGIFATTPAAGTIKNLYIENAAGVTLSQASTVSNNVYIGFTDGATTNITAVSNSIFNDGGNQLSSTGTLNLGTVPYIPVSTITNASQFILGAGTSTAYPAFSTNNIGAGTTIGYASALAQNISPSPGYYNLSLTGAGVKTLGGAITAYGGINIGSASALDTKPGNNYAITVGGSFTNAGIFTGRSGTVTFNGGAANTQIESTTQALSGGTGGSFFNILHNNSDLVRLTGQLITGGTFTNASGAGNFDANGNTHTVAGPAGINGGTYLAGTALQTFDGGLTIAGGNFSGSSGPVTSNNIALTSGSLTAPSGVFSVYGNWVHSGGTFIPGTNTVTFTLASGTQTISTGSGGAAVATSNFYNIAHTQAGTLQILTGSAPLTTGGTFTNASGIFDANTFAHTVSGLTTVSGGSYLAKSGTQSLNGGVTVSGGVFTGSTGVVTTTNVVVSSGTLTAPSSAGAFNVGGTWSNALTASFNANGGTVLLNGNAVYGTPAQTIGGAQPTNFNNLNIQSLVSTTLGVNIGISGTLAVSTSSTATIFDMSTFTANGTSAGNFTVTGTGTLRLSGTTGGITGSNFPNGFNHVSLTSFSTTEYYDGTSGQTIASLASPQAFSYGNLTLTNNSVKTAPAALTINNNVLINTGATLSAGAFIHNVGASWTNNGIFNGTGSTINFNGASTGNTISGILTGTSKFNFLTFNGAGGWSFSNPADVAADFTVTNGSVTAPSGLLNVAGNWNNNGGTFSANGGTVSLNGGVAQAIKGTQSTTFGTLSINNAAGLKDTLQTAISATTLSLTKGYIDVSKFSLSLSSSAAIAGASASSFVVTGNGTADGKLIVNGITTSGFTFPVGVDSLGLKFYYLPATITPTAGFGGMAWSAKVFTPVTPTSVYGAPSYSGAALSGIVNAEWVVEPTNTNVATAALTLNWVPQLEGSTFKMYVDSYIGISHYDGVAWDNATHSTASHTGYTVTSTFTSFSPFAIGATGDPLPVILVDFNAVLNNNKTVELTWTTPQEINTSHFEIERSADGIKWENTGTVQSTGNSSLPANYSYIDATPLSTNYYRIKIVNINGAYGYTTERFIKLQNLKEAVVFPNPAKNYVNISVSKTDEDLNIKLINQIGQVLKVAQVKAGTGILITLDVNNYAQGTYFIQVSSKDGTEQTSKIIIMR